MENWVAPGLDKFQSIIRSWIVFGQSSVKYDIRTLGQSKSRKIVTWWSHDDVTSLQKLQSLSSLKE